MKVKQRKESKDLGSVMRTQEKKDSQVSTQKPNSGFWALKVLTLSANCTADRSKKESRRAMARKVKGQDPASVRGCKEKAMQHGKMTGKTQLSGEKENAKKARKE